MLREIATNFQTQLMGRLTQSQNDWVARLEDAVSAIEQTSRDTARARLWAVVSAAISGAIALGIVGVLTAPAWLEMLQGRH